MSGNQVKPSELIRAGIQVLKRDGWIQGAYGLHADCHSCGVGAVYKASRESTAPDTRGACTTAVDALHASKVKRYNGSFTQFNDAPGRTQNEVMRSMERTADALEAVGK